MDEDTRDKEDSKNQPDLTENPKTNYLDEQM